LQNILDKDLQIGDEVIVERAGDVIPYIVSASPGAERRPCVIENCPSCGAALVQDLPELRCVNPDCFETRLQHLLSAIRNIGIERLGEPNLRKIMKGLQVRSLSDLFRIKPDDLLRLEGYQKLSAENLYREIQNARTVPDWQILAALNIRGIGPNLAKGILSVCSLADLRQYSVEMLAGLDQVGPERAAALWQELHHNHESLDELLQCVTVIESLHGKDDSPRKTICFTGKMPEKRSFYEQLAKQAGYEAVDSVNSSLNLLVAADPLEGNSSRLKKAAKLSIPVVGLDEWLSEIANHKTVPPPAEDELPLSIPEESEDAETQIGSEYIIQGELF
jgi:DNA ligase (NAD+)